MATAIKQRFDQAPLAVRKKPQPAALTDHPLLYRSEKAYREALFRDFVKFASSYGGVVISVPWCSPAVVLVELGENSPLEKALQAVPRFKVTRLPGTAIRLSHGRFRELRSISVVLWP